MKLPVTFDENEWFICITLFVSIMLFFRIRSRLPKTFMVMIFIVTMFFAKIVDTVFGMEPFDFYHINDTHTYDLFDFLTWVTYSFFGYFLIYLYDRFQFKAYGTWAYIVVWAFGSTFFEWIAVKLNVFNYLNWNITYSFCFYLIAISLMLLYYRFIKKYFIEMKQSSSL